jgi:hypothetical protein
MSRAGMMRVVGSGTVLGAKGLNGSSEEGAAGGAKRSASCIAAEPEGTVSLRRLLDESPWLQFTSECQLC